MDKHLHQTAQFNTPSEMTTRKAATILQVSTRTIQLWADKGFLQVWKTAGGHRRVGSESVKKMLDGKKEKLNLIGKIKSKKATTALIVDDDKDALLLCQMLLKSWFPKLRIETAQNGVDALVKVGQFKPRVLITCLHMPLLEGAGIIETLSNGPQYHYLTPIILTGLGEDAIMASNLPKEVPVVQKPIPVDVLKELVLTALRKPIIS